MSKIVNEIKRHPLTSNSELVKCAMNWTFAAGQYAHKMATIRRFVKDENKAAAYAITDKEYSNVTAEIADNIRDIIGSKNVVAISSRKCAFIEFDLNAEELKDTKNVVRYDERNDVYTAEVGDDVKAFYEEYAEGTEDGKSTKEDNM